MFEINKYLISKMGWIEYSMSRGVGIHYQSPLIQGKSEIIQPFADDPLVRFFITIKDHYICYIIKEFSEDEKQLKEKSYKFIRMSYKSQIISERGQPKFLIKEFNSNTELFGLISKYKACNSEYHRYFTLNNILNKENEEN
jgi:hypothetical protein